MDKIKIWAFPGLMSILCAIIWQDVKEIKSDVKALIAQSNQDKIRIDNLEREIYGDKTAMNTSNSDEENMPHPPVKLMLSEFILTKDESEDEDPS